MAEAIEAMAAMGGMSQQGIRELVGKNEALFQSLRKLDPVAGAITFGGLLTA